jgi:phosphoesterase RecJ-like protein
MYKKDHIQTHDGAYKYDLIIVLDSEDLESLGDVFTAHKDFFYDTTILNIDHKPENDEFGQINLINPNMPSTCEIIYTLIEELPYFKDSLTQEIAQCLLTGIIAKTKSFKSIKVTPKTLSTASKLMKAGADRDEIVKHLYYTKSIATLKLWGKVLSRLKSDDTSTITWSYVHEEDFTSLKVSPQNLHEVIDELILTAPEAKIIVILYEYKKVFHGLIYSDTQQNSRDLVDSYNPSGSKRLATFSFTGTSLSEGGKEVIEHIKKKLS